jgi:hypothetical protein
MKSTIFTFILFCILSLSVFAQGETKKTEAYKVDEIEATGDCDINNRVQNVRDTNAKLANVKFLFLIYRGFKDKRSSFNTQKRLLERNIMFLFEDANKTIVQEAGFREKYIVEFWIVPEGAEMPKPTNVAEKIDEIGAAPSGDLKNRLFVHTNKFNDEKLFILNFGSKVDKLKRTKTTLNLMKILGIDENKISIIDGGYSKNLKTEFWILKK